ncbi:hypothetical protein V6N12_036884 [Hibiscus sabdariffa]|uniref:Secreted protein n=1 Tax=Hibiscus sabdariffa TaxID=183260 RepID=A0ABR2BVD6_9ROSI
MMWYLLCLLAGLGGDCSSSSGLEGVVLDTVRPAGALPFLWVEVFGMVRSAEVKIAGVGAGESVGTSVGAGLFVCLAVELSGTCAAVELGRMRCGVPLVIANQKYHSHHRMRDEILQFRQPSQMGWQLVVVEWQRRSWFGVLPWVVQRRRWQQQGIENKGI